MKPKKYFIRTYGCQANEADSGKIAGIFGSLGFKKAKSVEECDVFVVNTCSVRQKSEDKVYGIGKKLKRNPDRPFVIMSGCMVGSALGKRKRYKLDELREKTHWVDEYIGPDQIEKIPEILLKEGIIDNLDAKKAKYNSVFPDYDSKKWAQVNISSGCDNFCSYCVVPYARGEEVSKDKAEIIQEISDLLDRGYTNIMLCGQNVNSWGLNKDKKFDIRIGSNQKLPFAELLREIHGISRIEKISFMSSNPFDFTKDLINTLKLPKIDKYLHIAVQSGNNDVLASMNRRHTVEEFIDLINRIKAARPDAEIGTDAIVGFPGETREQFMDTVELFKSIGFNVAFISMYSPRNGTYAEINLKDDVSLKEKKWRHSYLTKVWKETKP